MHFYGKLATEDLGAPGRAARRARALTTAEREAARRNPGFERALLLISIGLRDEGVVDGSSPLRGLDDRQLLAAAQLACDREVWDRCINTSDRTRTEVDMAQRFRCPIEESSRRHARSGSTRPTSTA